MKKIFFTFCLITACIFLRGQTVSQKISEAYSKFEADSQLQNAITSLYVIDAVSGKVVFDKNSRIGLAPASTQKIITAASAYELLGKNFQYKTELGYTGNISNGILRGHLFIKPSGDPTLGSWRWENTKEDKTIQRFISAIKKTGIEKFDLLAVDERGWNAEIIPDGWIWQDIGNYYGAGAGGLNWRENQYDLILRSGNNIGDAVEVVRTKPYMYGYTFNSAVTAAAKGTGDNAYIYFTPHHTKLIIRGTIPVSENNFTISGAMPSAKKQFLATLEDSLKTLKLGAKGATLPAQKVDVSQSTIIHTELSPPLDSIIYWFNKKSINLYGEALVRTIALQNEKEGDTDKGVQLIKNFWKSKGIPPTELSIVDGSGLSPLNRVTTHAQVVILQHARKQNWFNGFYFSLPEYNGMKLKSGTIRGAKAFAGYHKAKDGTAYIISFIVNNYNGSASSVVQKMYKVLDELK